MLLPKLRRLKINTNKHTMDEYLPTDSVTANYFLYIIILYRLWKYNGIAFFQLIVLHQQMY